MTRSLEGEEELDPPKTGLFHALVAQRSLIVVLCLALSGAGALSVGLLPSGMYPELDFPRIVVIARAGDDPPQLMQASVVRPLEEGLASIPGIRRIRTRIIRGTAELALQFEDGTDMRQSMQLVGSALADVRGSLPDGVELQSERLTPAEFPILSYNVVGGSGITRKEAADLVIRPVFARVPGVGRVEVTGGDEREIEVELDPTRLLTRSIRPSRVADALHDGLARTAVGRLDEYRQSVTAMASTGTTDTDTLLRLPVASGPAGPVALADVAAVSVGMPDRTLAVHGPEGDAVQVSVSRRIGASAPDIVKAVDVAAAGLRLPPGVRMVRVYDQGSLIRDSILGIRDAILIGIVLTIGVLAVFLRNARAGFLAASSVPITLVITFLAMQTFGQTLNLMSLGGMAIAISLIIDNGIIVVEAIYRRLEEGLGVVAACRGGLEEMTGPVIGTTVTTVVVLLPLGFLSGVAGSFFAALAITLGSAVALSMFYSLLVLPLLASRVLKKQGAHQGRKKRDRLAGRYGALLRGAVHRRAMAVAIVAAMLAAGWFALQHVPSSFLPEMDEGAFVLDYWLPPGTSLEATSQSASKIEAVMAEMPEIKTWSRRTGAEMGPITATELYRGDIAVLLKPRGERRASDEVVGDLRTRLETQLPGVRVEFVQVLVDVINDLSGNARPIEVKVLGPDQAVLDRIAADVSTRLDGTPNLVDWSPGVQGVAPMRDYRVDAGAASRVGLTPADVVRELGVAMHGEIVGDLPRLDRLVPVRVRFPDAVRHVAATLDAQSIATPSGPVALGTLAPATLATAPAVLFREDLTPVSLASGDVEGGDLGAVNREIDKRLKGLEVPPGYTLKIGGQIESQGRAFRQLALVLVLGLLAVLTVLVAQLKSLRAALLVLLTVPPALVGGLGALALTQVPLDVSSLMGLVLLVGLVVKNGILLVQQALIRMREGVLLGPAFVAAGRRRIRPILMTTLCTIFGLLPLALAIGAGSELQRPLAVAVIGGLVTSTAASLLLLPSLAGLLLPQRWK